MLGHHLGLDVAGTDRVDLNVLVAQLERDFFFYPYDDHLDLHGVQHSFPTRRSSDLVVGEAGPGVGHGDGDPPLADARQAHLDPRSEEHTSELQSLYTISYAVFCL